MQHAHRILLCAALALTCIGPVVVGVAAAPIPSLLCAAGSPSSFDGRSPTALALAQARALTAAASSSASLRRPRSHSSKRAPALLGFVGEDALLRALDEADIEDARTSASESSARGADGFDVADYIASVAPGAGSDAAATAHFAKRAPAPAFTTMVGEVEVLDETVVTRAMEDPGRSIRTALRDPWAKPGPSPLRQAHRPAQKWTKTVDQLKIKLGLVR